MRDGGTARPDKGHKKTGAKTGGNARGKNAGASAEPRSPSGNARQASGAGRGAGRGPQPGGARLITIGGGKGGVGKSFVSANLAASLAAQKQRVVVVDADLEGANLHTCLGVPAPPASLADFAAGRELELAKLAFDTTIPNLRLVAGTDANLATPQPSHQQRVQLISQLRALDADFVILDLGAGTAAAVIDYFSEGDDEILVIQPEPTSVENAYSFLRAAFYRRMRMAMQRSEIRQLVSQAMDQKNERGIRTPLDLLREVQKQDPSDGTRFIASMRGFRPRIIMNGVRSAEDIRVGFAVRSVCRKYFGIDAEYLGYVNHDEAVHRSVLARSPLVVNEPGCDAAKYLGRIAQKLATEERTRRKGSAPGFPIHVAAGAARAADTAWSSLLKPISEQDHYEILELPRGASQTAVERAYRLARTTFADDSLALYSVVDPRDAETIRLRVEEAHTVLSDPEARRNYDAELDPGETEEPLLPIQFDAEPTRVAVSPASPGVLGDLAPGEAPARYDGATFRAARLRNALDLSQIAEITKVNPRYLRYIEEEHVEGLPARVYVRGFVEAYSRVIGFDPERSVTSYMELFDQGSAAPPKRSRFLGRT